MPRRGVRERVQHIYFVTGYSGCRGKPKGQNHGVSYRDRRETVAVDLWDGAIWRFLRERGVES
jgi:hypothetical protein